MIVKTLLGTTFFCVALVWGVLVIIERDPCAQVQAAAAPVRLVMQAARAIDRNLEFVADRYTWWFWSIKADAMAQAGVAKLLHGSDLQCKSF